MIIEVTIINPRRRHYVDFVITKLVDGNQLGEREVQSPNMYDSEESIPPGYIGWWNRFLGVLNVHKFGLCSVGVTPPRFVVRK